MFPPVFVFPVVVLLVVGDFLAGWVFPFFPPLKVISRPSAICVSMDGVGVLFFFSILFILFAIVVFIRVSSADVPPVAESLRVGIAWLVGPIFVLDPQVVVEGCVEVVFPSLDETNPELVVLERL